MGQWSTQWIKCAHTKSTNLPRSLGTHLLTLFKVYLKWVHISVGVFIFYKITSRAFCIFNWEKKKDGTILKKSEMLGLSGGLRALAAYLQRARVWFPELTRWVTIICNSISRCSDAPFWPLEGTSIHVVHRYTCRQNTHVHKKIKNLIRKCDRNQLYTVYKKNGINRL